MFKTRMLAKASISEVVVKELTDVDILAAKANSKEEVVTLEAQKDLMRLVSILVSTGMNRNDDVFLREEVLPIRNTGAHKPVNLEHDPEQIIGHMTKTYVTLKDGTIVDDEDNNVPEDFDLTNEAVIYKFIFPDIAQYIKEKAAANSLFVSIEMWFDDYDYLLDNVIVRRNADTSSILDKHLRINKGEGFYEGRKLGRVLRNCLIAGIGIVKNPANLESVIKSVSSADSKFVLIEDKAIITNVLGSVDTYGKVTAMIKGDEAKLLNTKAQEVDMVLPNPAEPVLSEPALPEGSIAPTITIIPVPVQVPVTPLIEEVMEKGNIFMAKDEEDIVIGHFADIVEAKLEEIKSLNAIRTAEASKLAEAALSEVALDGLAITAKDLLAERDMWKSECERLNKENCQLNKEKKMRNRCDLLRSMMSQGEMDQMMKDEDVDNMDDCTFEAICRAIKRTKCGAPQVSTNNAKEGGLTPVVANQEAAPAPTPAPVAAPVQPTATVTEPAPVADPAPTAPVAPVAEPKAPEAPATPAPQTVVAPEVPVVPPAPIVEPVVEPAPIPPAPVVDAVPSLDKVQPVDPPIAVVTNNPTAPSITQQMGEVLIDLLSRSNPKWKNLKL